MKRRVTIDHYVRPALTVERTRRNDLEATAGDASASGGAVNLGLYAIALDFHGHGIGKMLPQDAANGRAASTQGSTSRLPESEEAARQRRGR
jgi:hypothetical protein